jgi:hypothetical protein
VRDDGTERAAVPGLSVGGGALKLFATTDVAASIRAAHSAFTHVLVNRGYTTIKPVYFRSSKIADLPVYAWASWDKATESQLRKWREKGGVLIDRDKVPNGVGPADVLLFVECPLTVRRIEFSMREISEYGVIPRPHTWRVHEDAIDLRTPPAERLRALWDICRGARITDDELAEQSTLPKQVVQYQRNSFKPVEEWEIRPRIAPEAPGLLPAWEWVGKGRTETKNAVRGAGHKIALKEMARLGHVALKRFQRYPSDEPDWTRLEDKRQTATADLRQIQSLLATLPDHLPA